MICKCCGKDCEDWCGRFPHLSKRGLQFDGTSRIPLLDRLTEWETHLEGCADMCDLAVDYQTISQATSTIRRFLELSERLEVSDRTEMTELELRYLQLRHDLLGRET